MGTNLQSSLLLVSCGDPAIELLQLLLEHAHRRLHLLLRNVRDGGCNLLSRTICVLLLSRPML